MSQPLAKFYILGTSTQGQEVAPHIQRGVLLLEEVLGGIGVIRGEVVHRETVSERLRVGNGARLRSLRSLCRALGRLVLVVSPAAEPLTTVGGG
jgi:hypothetical protein